MRYNPFNEFHSSSHHNQRSNYPNYPNYPPDPGMIRWQAIHNNPMMSSHTTLAHRPAEGHAGRKTPGISTTLAESKRVADMRKIQRHISTGKKSNVALVEEALAIITLRQQFQQLGELLEMYSQLDRECGTNSRSAPEALLHAKAWSMLGGAFIDRIHAVLRAVERNEAAADFLARLEFLFNPKSKFDVWRSGKLDAARYLAQERFYGMETRERRIQISDFIEELSISLSAVREVVDHRAGQLGNMQETVERAVRDVGLKHC
ncbi:hypothetical protein MMC30_002049 [Trapelia coarctata]|nr:hypothetical protein [Trapelia coarctata]